MWNTKYDVFVIVIPGFLENEGDIEMMYRVYQVINWYLSQIGKADVLGLPRIWNNWLLMYQEALKQSGYDHQLTIPVSCISESFIEIKIKLN